jgi:ribosome recycling factor
MIKLVHSRVEDSRVAVRNVRRDGMEHLKRLVQNKEASEDAQHNAQEQLQKLTDRYISEVDQRGRAKEAELLEV